jgi:predicted membrane protein
MPSFFLIPLFTGLITGYFVKKSTDELAYIVGVFAAISLLVSLLLAPWQIQFVLLIFVLISTNKLLHRDEYQQTDARRQQPRETK